MKGNPELIDALNSLLESELTSINQYMVPSQMNEVEANGSNGSIQVPSAWRPRA